VLAGGLLIVTTAVLPRTSTFSFSVTDETIVNPLNFITWY